MRDARTGTGYFRHAGRAFSARKLERCLELLDRAQACGCHPDECAAYRWQCWMLLGQFEWAWRESDAIAARGGVDPHRFWDGRSFRGKRVIIRTLHGFGDAIQFVRYAELMKRDAAEVTIQTHPQLVSLLRGVAGVDRVITWGEDRCDWDQQIEVMELPRAFRTTIATIPCRIPYLKVDSALVESSRRVLGPSRGPRVGLMWNGSDYNPARNLCLSELSLVLETAGVEFYSFQRGAGQQELRMAAGAGPIVDLSGDRPDVRYFAADLLNMDLLISVDTMGAHLAGALGVPVWVLLGHEADWRWMVHREDSPWYPTMRLFRQTKPGDWSEPVARVASALQALAQPGEETQWLTA